MELTQDCSNKRNPSRKLHTGGVHNKYVFNTQTMISRDKIIQMVVNGLNEKRFEVKSHWI